MNDNNQLINNVKSDVAGLREKQNRDNKRNRAGIASAVAIASIPQATTAGRSMFGVGAGGHRGEHAIAVGYSHSSSNGKHIIKLNTGADTRNGVSYGAGYGYQW
ncbi:YadA-like protein [Pasteurella langaaensis DSM 22999]|uniref:YadA-like protein n=1 Tax=Alitibacter langaaensis DSM 22999 TaxID=1122935 RepID=A0A2U0SKF5_9PAST|nr:YadA-like protein [Pasteurella langaaensis DSM 22999]